MQATGRGKVSMVFPSTGPCMPNIDLPGKSYDIPTGTIVACYGDISARV